jgi:nucleotide-binding universal stress UspA family protein/GNAT superfamily N-acetyltransferase
LTVELRADRKAVLRPLVDSDRERLIHAFDRLSDESRYRRFFTPIHVLDRRFLEYLTDIDHRNHEAIVAIDPQSGDLLGVARYVRLEEDANRAEAAVVVVDDWQGHGLGRALLEHLVARARAEGIGRFTALVQAENRRALDLLTEIGRTTRSPRDDHIELDIELGEHGLGAPLTAALRAAAASVLGARPLSERLARLAKELWEGRTEAAQAKASDAPIVVGTDGSDTAARAVACAAKLARQLHVALHVVTAYRAGGRQLPQTELAAAPRDVEWQLNPRAEAEAALTETVAGLSDETRRPHAHAREGNAAEVLIDFAGEVGAQLLVVGNKGMTGASRFLLGSVPDKVSHHAGCSVLIVRTTIGR